MKTPPEIRNSIMRIAIGDHRYTFQIIPMTNDVGEKLVWVNAFCSSFIETMQNHENSKSSIKWEKKQIKRNKDYKPSHFDWRKKVVCVNDGYNCFWNVKLNLDTNNYFELGINGM